MDAAGAAAKFRALDAELAATSSRVAELEARVSLLEAENGRLRRALASGGATGCAGERDPESDRLAAGSGGSKRESVEKLSRSVACDVIEVSDDEEVAAVGAERGRSPDPEEGFVAAIPTPRNRAVRVVPGDSEDEDDAEGGGGGSGKANSVGLEDEDVLAAPRGRKRKAARVVTSDSEDEDVIGGELGSGKDDADQREQGLRHSKKRGLCGIQICDSEDEDATEGVDVVTRKAASLAQMESGEDEDDMVPICQVLKKMRKETASDESGEQAKVCSTPATRRSARLVKNQTKGARSARRVLNFVEPKEHEGSEDDTEEDSDMEDFINDDDSSENASDSAEESCDEPEVSGTSVLDEQSSPGPEESDSEVDYADVMARIGRKKKAKDWKFEGDMLAAFDEHPELCLKAVCALYRKQTEEEQKQKATFVHNKQGFNQIHAQRGSRIAEFLLDGDLYGPLKKTISELEEYDRSALEFCRRVLVVTSDSEDEDVNGGELGGGMDDVGDQEEGVKASRKRGLRGISDSEDEDVTEGVHVVASRVVAAQIESGGEDEDEDDMVPIRQVLKKMRKERVSEGDADDGFREAIARSTPTRRSARLVKNQSKGGRASSRVNYFVELKGSEGSEDDMEEFDDMEKFINDEDSSENASDSAEESCEEPEMTGTSVMNEESSFVPEESDSVADYADVMACIGRKKRAKDWKFEGDMLASFAEHPELCLKAVCALYRRQTHEEQLEKAALVHNKEGFNHIDATRGSDIAEFLLDGDLGPLKKTISDLEKFDASALRFCCNVASKYSKQLFAIYQNKEDPYFHP